MKYLRLFKAKKPLGQFSQAERLDFSKDLASNILENIISAENLALAAGLRDAELDSFKNTKEDFIRICGTREVLKTIESETLDKAFEKHSFDYLKYLNSIKAIQEKNLVEVSTRYLTLEWIDKSIHKRSLDLYNRLLDIKSELNKLGLWTADLETAYKNASFGKSGYKPGSFVNCSVVIKQKDRFKLFDSAWDLEFYPLFQSETYKESIELGSVAIWSAITKGMIPDLYLVFRECSGWLK
jgi:hypothetical protein